MKPTQKELTDWAIAQIETKYKDDVALLIAIEGHSLDNDCHGLCFDYFVPATDRGNQLSKTFILDGVGHDLYPRSWKRIEAMANFEDEFTFGLGEAKILYARSEEDKNRFIAMQEKQRAHLADKEFMYKKALEKLEVAMDLYRTMTFEERLYNVRMAAGFIGYYLSVAIACINGVYFKQRLDLEATEVAQFEKVPEGFVRIAEAIVYAETQKQLKDLSYELITLVRKFLTDEKPEREVSTKEPVYEDLAGWYEEGSLTWRRIYYHCDTNQVLRVFRDAINLQNELNYIKDEFVLKEMDLLGCFDPKDLKSFKENAHIIEAYIISVIEANGVTINRYATLEEFLEKNS